MLKRIFTLLLALSVFVPLEARVPRPLPEIPISQPGGKSFRLQQYPGKVMAILLFSTNCAECVESAALLDKAQKQFAARGFQAVAAAVNIDAPEAVQGFIDRYRPGYPVGFLKQEQLIKFADLDANARPFVPIFIFVDHKGTIRFQYFGRDPIMSQQEKATMAIIDSLLKSRNSGK
jgi:hypothetical protein